jgi:hypothetical protein
MSFRTLGSVVAAAVIAATCDSSTAPPAGDRLAELAQSESKWKGQGLHDYFFDYHSQFGGAIAAARIYVNADSVAAAMDSVTGKELSHDPGHAWPTVDSLFARARAALASTGVDASVSYDATLGYPTRIDISPVMATPAGGSSSRASNLKRMVVLTAQ